MIHFLRPSSSASPLAAASRLAFVAFALLALAALPTGCDEGVTEGADQRADHRCGPNFEDAVCGANRCCSASDFCGSLDQTHCGAANGYGGAYDGPRTPTGGGGTVDCAGLCTRQTAVVAELGCTDARTESECLTACNAAASDPAAEPCKAEQVAQVACVAAAPTADFSCPTEPGEAPSLDIGEGSACGDEVGAFISCVFSSN